MSCERPAQRGPGIGGLVAQRHPPASGEVHDQVERREREVDEFPAALAAVEGQPLERGDLRVEGLEHRHRADGHARDRPAAQAGVEGPAERFDLGQLRHRG